MDSSCWSQESALWVKAGALQSDQTLSLQGKDLLLGATQLTLLRGCSKVFPHQIGFLGQGSSLVSFHDQRSGTPLL